MAPMTEPMMDERSRTGMRLFDFLPREAAVFAGKIELLFKGLADAGTGRPDG